MPRSRNIKPGFFSNDDLAELPYETRLLFIGLWTLADREGKLEDRPRKIKMQIFPADNIDIEKNLEQLFMKKFIERYSVDDKCYIFITNFSKHQAPHVKEKPSKIPNPVSLKNKDLEKKSLVQAPYKPGASTVLAPTLAVASPYLGSGQHPLIPDILIPDTLIPDSPNTLVVSPSTKKPSSQKIKKNYPEEFESFWKAYPKNTASKKETFASIKKIKDLDYEQLHESVEHYKRYLAETGYSVMQCHRWLDKGKYTVDYQLALAEFKGNSKHGPNYGAGGVLQKDTASRVEAAADAGLARAERYFATLEGSGGEELAKKRDN